METKKSCRFFVVSNSGDEFSFISEFIQRQARPVILFLITKKVDLF